MLRTLGSSSYWADERRVVILLMGIALGVRLIYVSIADAQQFSDMARYDRFALSITSGGYPEAATIPPGYPFFLAGVYSVFGHSILWAGIIQAIIGSAYCGLVYFITRQTFTKKAAVIAALIVALYVELIVYSAMLLSESLFILQLLAMVSAILIARRSKSPKSQMLIVALAGIILGTAILTRPVAFVLPVAFLLWMLATHVQFKRALIHFAVLLLFAGFIVAPWTIRNWIVLDGLVVTHTRSSVNFWMGNNIDATGRYLWSDDDNPFMDIEDPVEFENAVRRATIDFALEEPGRFVVLTLKKMALFWEYRADGFAYTFLEDSVGVRGQPWRLLTFPFMAIVLLSIPGISMWAFRESRETGLLLVVVIIAIFLLTSLAHIAPRYHLPLIPLLAVFAGQGISSLLSWRRNIRLPLSQIPREALMSLLLAIPFLGIWGHEKLFSYSGCRG